MTQPLRIALFTYSTQPRGSVVHTLELAIALHGLGQEVCIYALDKDGSGFGRSLPCQVKLIPAQPAPADIDRLIQQRIQEFVDYLSAAALTYDCYHAQDCLSANALAHLRTAGKIPAFIRTVHHIEAFTSPYLQRCQDRSIQEADLCLCVSQIWQQALREQYQVKAPRVNNGVNLARFRSLQDGSEPRFGEVLGLSNGPVYLTVGGIEPRKNSITLLQAFAQVLVVHPQAQLVIAGGATLFDYQSYRAAFFAEAEGLGIEIGKSVLLPGVIAEADLPTLYRLADAFVFPSLQEGWGLVVLEALASGIPVITARQPPFTEFLSDQDALLVDPQDVEAIAQAMRSALQPKVALSLCEQGLQVVTRYTWDASAQQHLQYYLCQKFDSK